MATQATMVANPTAADVNVGGKIAKAGEVTLLQIDDAVITEYNGFLTAGCAMLRNAVGTESQRIQAGYLLYNMEGIA